MIAASLQTVMAFNLICTGTQFIGSRADIMKKENHTPYSATFRIDLSAGRWCAADCTTTARIHTVGETKIVLKFEEDKSISTESFIAINREDGSILDRTKIDTLLIMHTGTCERAPFTGFPARKF